MPVGHRTEEWFKCLVFMLQEILRYQSHSPGYSSDFLLNLQWKKCGKVSWNMSFLGCVLSLLLYPSNLPFWPSPPPFLPSPSACSILSSPPKYQVWKHQLHADNTTGTMLVLSQLRPGRSILYVSTLPFMGIGVAVCTCDCICALESIYLKLYYVLHTSEKNWAT